MKVNLFYIIVDFLRKDIEVDNIFLNESEIDSLNSFESIWDWYKTETL